MKIKTILVCLILSFRSLSLGNYSNLTDCDSYFFYDAEYGSFGFGMDWLYWKAKQDHTQIEAILDTHTLMDKEIKSSVLKPQFNYSNGVRVYTDYTTADHCWRWQACYSSFSTSKTEVDERHCTNIVFNFDSIFNIQDQNIKNIVFENIKSKYNLDFDYLDLDFSKPFVIYKKFNIEPHLGLRGQWITKKIKISEIDELFLISKLREKLYGFGLEGGVLGTWNIGCGFSIVGHLGGSLVYTYSGNKGSLNVIKGPSSYFSYSDSSSVILPSIETFLGINCFQRLFHKNFNMRIGWENHVIFNVNSCFSSRQENLSLQGLTFGGSVGF